MPGWLTRFLLRARATVSARHDRELRDELDLHLQLLEEEYAAQGILAGRGPAARPPRVRQRDAVPGERATTCSRFGSSRISSRTCATRCARCGAAWGSPALRCCSLAVGIGAVTAAFAVVDAFMLRGLPVRDPERLVAFSTSGSPDWGSWPYAAFLAMAGFARRAVRGRGQLGREVARGAVARERRSRGDVRVSLVSGNYFQVMGADVALGRSLADADARRARGRRRSR